MSVIKIRSVITSYNSSRVSLRNFLIPIFFISTNVFLRYGYKVSVGIYYYVFLNSSNRISLCNNEHIIRRRLKSIFKNKGKVSGFISRKVKGGYEVNVSTLPCFLPSSLSNNELEFNVLRNFKVIRFSNNDGNIVLSRKDYIEDKKVRIIEELMVNEPKIITVIIKSISKFGIFATYRNIDGLLRVNRSALRYSFLKEGSKVKAMVYRWNSSIGRVTYRFYNTSLRTKRGVISNLSLYREVFKGKKFSKLSFNNCTYILNRSDMNWVVRDISSKTYIRYLYKKPSHNVYIYNPWVDFSLVSNEHIYGSYYKEYSGIYIYKLPFHLYGFCSRKISSAIFTIKYVNILKRLVILV
ncbi:hypothetical protein [Candidatus Vidania fulgoroideorum]